MDGFRFLAAAFCLYLTGASSASELRLSDEQPLRLAPVGGYQLRVLAPNLLELTLVTAPAPGSSRAQTWDFVDQSGQVHLPAPDDFIVSAGGRVLGVTTVGFKRRVLYAPLKERDLRLGNYLYLKLAEPVAETETVEVKNRSGKLWPATDRFLVQVDPLRWSPVLHVNQTGYLPLLPKKAMVGYYLGSMGEMDAASFPTPRPATTNAAARPSQGQSVAFRLLDAHSGRSVFEGFLAPRPDHGFPFPCYQQVLEADFTRFQTPGEYRLSVPGLGVSFPFQIGQDVAGSFARTYALGLYHQRCGTDNSLPFTRFTHLPCHTAAADVPTLGSKFAFVNECLAKMTEDYKENPRHTAPQLKNVGASLYPFVNPGPVNVRGGHHDAGDYSKYTINSAAFIHYLVFAADAFPGVSDLDNLGLPESGDGKSDLLEEAKWEADFLAEMQDADGGFYFLVYPREREYEDNVLPDHGDPQVVFPKTTAATAAATAVLAQCASSPTFKRQFPEAAAHYLAAAVKGWAFLQEALARHGKDGAYQKITHYGDQFMHDDELAWAACELFLATGNDTYAKKLKEWLDPTDPNTRRWGWWRLSEAYGCAIRSYAFAARTGRLKRDQLNPLLLEQCENEIAAAGEEQLKRAHDSAYGTSFPEETKRTFSAGWYFSEDVAFDLAVACQLDYPSRRDPRPSLLEAIITNLGYEQGCNPVNVTYLTGLGWKRQRAIVSQYAKNDRRILPPSGIPLGNIQAGLGWNNLYQKEPDQLSFPPDGAPETPVGGGQAGDNAPYPFYDRWADGFNLSQEFVILNQARGLGCLAWLMAQTPLKNQPWKSAAGQLVGLPGTGASRTNASLSLEAAGLDLSSARIVWEAKGQEPVFGACCPFAPGQSWLEAEAQLPDGRRVFGVKAR